MKNFTKLNVDQICYVESYLKARSSYYRYLPFKKKAWLSEGQKEGFYYMDGLDYKYMTKEEIEKDGIRFCEGKSVFFKPNIEIHMSDKSTHEKFFETPEELFAFMESEQMKKVNWINKS